MAIKWLAPVLILGFLIGCSSPPKIIREIETVEVERPILYCPAVDTEQLARPGALPIDTITKDTPYGEVSILYKATVKTLIDYTKRLELILQEYETYNKSYEDLIKELEQNREE